MPYVLSTWRKEHPEQQQPADGQIFTQPWPAEENEARRDQVIYYQYRHDRARRTFKGIDEQVAKAERAVAGKVPVKRNRFIRLTGGTRAANRELEAKTRALAGIKGYVTNLQACPDGTPISPEFVTGAYHQLVDQEVRQDRSPLPDRPDRRRRPPEHRRTAHPQRPTDRTRQNPQSGCALI